MVEAQLAISHRIDGRTSAKNKLVLGLEVIELPSDEGVIVLVDLSRDEGPSPVDAQTEPFEVLLRIGGEVLQPLQWLCELKDFIFRDIHLLEDFTLLLDRGSSFLFFVI